MNGKQTAKPTRATSATSSPKASAKPVVAPVKPRRLSPSKTNPKVRLEFYAPQAREVFVAGSFNEWRPQATALLSSSSGLWAREFALAPGRYEYLFLVDGQWLPDPQAKGSAPNPFGGVNSLLLVGNAAGG